MLGSPSPGKQELALLFTKDEAMSKFGHDSWQDKTQLINVRVDEHQELQFYLAKDSKKRPRSSLSPMSLASPSSKRLVAIQRQLKSESDLARKLQLLTQYRENHEYDRVDALIEKWKDVVRTVVEELWKEVSLQSPSLTREQFLTALQLGKKVERLVANNNGTEDEDGSSADESGMDCLND